MAFIIILVVILQKAACLELFKMVEGTALTRNFTLTTLSSLPTEYRVSFKFMPTSYLNNWASIIHLTTGENLFTYGSRIPAVFISPLNLLYFASDINGKQNCEAYSKTVIPLNKWVQVIISQSRFENQYKFTVDLANETIYSIENDLPTNFSNVKVFMSNPWYPAQPGLINNLEIVDNPSVELFKMVEGAAITKNFSLITLSSLPREYRVSFNFMPTTYLNDWASVIHFTIGENLFTYGSRIPAVFVSPLNLLYFASDISGKQNCETYLKTVIPLNKWVEIIMSQTKIANLYKFTVNVANETVYSIENDLPTSFSKVKVFMSNPWYPAQPGFINSLVIVDNPSVELFTMVERTAITRNFSLTTLDNLPTEYKVSFNFMPTTYLNNWASVIHLTTGDNLFTYGSRIPAVFVSPLNLLYFASDISGKQNCDAFSKTVIPLNKWVQVIISQTKFANQYKFIVNVANETVYSLENIFPTNFSNVKVFMSNPWYPPQPGFINSLTIVDNPSDKPVIKIRPSGQLIKTKFLTINTAISYAYETSPIAYNLTWEYMLPYFFKLISQSEVYLHKGSIYTIPGAFVTNNFNQYINITLEMTSCSQRGDFTLEIPVKFSFCDKDGYKWIQYTSFMTSVTTSFISDPENKKNKSVLEESYSRGICWDQLESLIYACLNLYVTTQKTACYVSNNYGEKWTKLDVRVGSVLGYHKLTRDLYVVHRNQKSFLMYHKIHKKWLVVPNKEFEENISKSLNSSACLKIEGTFEQVLTTESLQWMGNNEGLYFRNVFNTTWTRRIEWKELL